MSVELSIVIFAPIDHVGWASASSTVTDSQLGARAAAERAAARGEDELRRPPTGGPTAGTGRRAECSESTGTISPPPCVAHLRDDRAARDEALLVGRARAACRAASALSVAGSPAKPTTALSTTSASGCAASSSSGAGVVAAQAGARRARAPNSAACAASARRCGPRPARRGGSRRGWLRSTSSAWRADRARRTQDHRRRESCTPAALERPCRASA